ncbi:MAG: methyltransferase domain-containing protein [Alphaproteobacteria bacterium]|jgi:sarcosine/dimethylglycine N-methyltransferase|nr:methyltransferase domain-containing protein [Alphaproteobacteria bacterium]
MAELLADDTYRHEYTPDFVSRWDDLIGWEGRSEGEAGFFHRLLNAYGVESVVDCACGTGFHSIVLAHDGFEVYAADGAPTMIDQTRENAEKARTPLADARVVDWRDLAATYGENRFDALICLGNAFTHLFDHEARRDALASMFAVVKPGGLVCIDHRNYDSILDHGYSSKQQFYYTGDGVDARPVTISRTLCKFEYKFPNGDVHSLQMYPLRQNYLSHLLDDAGFVDVTRYGDFLRPYSHYDVDFVQQVAFKPLGRDNTVKPHRRDTVDSKAKRLNKSVREAREYYDGAADEIYREIWGENIHIGTFELDGESLQAAMDRSNRKLADLIQVDPRGVVLDVGCGYGAFARYLSRRLGCRVLATNISERELEWGRELTAEAGLDDLVNFEWADFHDLPYDAETFDVYTSQEAFLHAADKKHVLEEAMRVLKPGGRLVFSDLLIRASATAEDRERIFARIKLSDMWDMPDYEQALKELGFEIETRADWSQNVSPTYDWVRTQLLQRRGEFDEKIGADLVDRTAQALQFWVDGGNQGKIGWGAFVAKKV